MLQKTDSRYPRYARDLDFALAQQALSGDVSAWNELYIVAHPLVLKSVQSADYHNLLTHDERIDITDEAFKRCYEQLNRYQGLSRFHRWVTGYAKKLLQNLYSRKATVRRNQYLLKCITESQARNQNPLLILIQLERNQFLWEAFYQLTDTEQNIVYCILFLRFSPRKISKMVQLTRKQVLQAYNDALFKIRWQFLRLYR